MDKLGLIGKTDLELPFGHQRVQNMFVW